MDAPLWSERPLPRPLPGQLLPWAWELQQPADLTRSRTELRVKVLSAGVPPGHVEDDVERLLLAYEELASNGIRHGRAPVRAAVTAADNGWLIDVTDTGLRTAPAPAAGRDPALGWSVTEDRKHVWGYLRLAAAP
jgi:anti-sigma regulatory factor (Ser/Thr protein kinase)